MFPSRYFADRYFNPRYWVPVGEDDVSVAPPSLYRPLHAQQGDTRRLAASRSIDTSRLAAQEDQSRRLKATEPYS